MVVFENQPELYFMTILLSRSQAGNNGKVNHNTCYALSTKKICYRDMENKVNLFYVFSQFPTRVIYSPGGEYLSPFLLGMYLWSLSTSLRSVLLPVMDHVFITPICIR